MPIFIEASKNSVLTPQVPSWPAQRSTVFTSVPGTGNDVVTRIGDVEIKGFNEAALKDALKKGNYPASANKDKLNWGATIAILTLMMIYVTMVYGPIAAFLVELFPTRIRYTSMSLPYHIGNGWFGGMLPLLATAMVAATGDIYFGLWYPIGVAVMSLVIGTLFLKDNKDRPLNADD